MHDFEKLFDDRWVLGRRFAGDKERLAHVKILRERITLAREERAKRQEELRLRFQQPLISMTMNVPGPDKDLPLAELLKRMAVSCIESAFFTSRIKIDYSESRKTAAGPEFFLVPEGIGARALKRMMIDIENSHPLGRFFDIDVIDADGTHLERASFGFPPRQCIICDRPAIECIRKGTHSLDELLDEMGAMVLTYLREAP